MKTITKILFALSLLFFFFTTVYALRVVYVGEIDLLVYCTEGELQTIEHDGYIQVTCLIEDKTFLPAILKQQGE